MTPKVPRFEGSDGVRSHRVLGIASWTVALVALAALIRATGEPRTAGVTPSGEAGNAARLDSADPPAGAGFWVSNVVGATVMLFGLGGLLLHATTTHPLSWIRWSAAVLIAHDLIFVPLVLAGGRLLRWRLRPELRAPVLAALVVSGMVVLASLPVLIAATGIGQATQPGNTSLLPTNYPLALAFVILVTWAVAGLAGVWLHMRNRRVLAVEPLNNPLM